MKLVEAPGHLFSRWDDPEGKFNGVPDRFNIDASGHGFACHPDEHYLTWPREWTDVEKEQNWYLKSLTPLGELAGFLATRGACLEDNGRLYDAFLSLHWAYQLTKDKRYYQEAAKLQQELERQQRALEETVRRLEEERRERQQRAKKTSSKPEVKRDTLGGVAPLTLRDVGHGSGCECLNCQRERAQKMAQSGGDFGHGPSCQCLHCRQNRQMAKTAGSPPGPPHQHLHSPHFP